MKMRSAVNLGSEYPRLSFRPAIDYKFRDNYIDRSSRPKQLVLGVPAKIPTETRWKIEFGKTQTNASKTLEGERQGGTAIGDYEENALVVGEVLWAHMTRDNNDRCIYTICAREDLGKATKLQLKEQIPLLIIRN